MRIVRAGVLLLVFFSCRASIAAAKDIEGYAGFSWRMTIEEARSVCGPFFSIGKEGEYYCDRVKEFQGVDMSKGFGIAKKKDLYRPPVKRTILKFVNDQLFEIDILFAGRANGDPVKSRESLLAAYQDFLNILKLEFDLPVKSAKPGEISLYVKLDVWSGQSGCMMLVVPSNSSEGRLKIIYKERCGSF